MHEFDFINRPKELLTPEVVALLTRLHECRGRQELFIEAEPDVLTALLEVAKIQSTDASNRIEGIYTSDERLKAISRHGVPEIINSDQGCQFTGKEWADACSQHSEMKVSMDGRGRAKDNIWIERFCKTIKYEYIYIQPEENGADLFFGIKRFIDNYNYHRRHQGINRTVPSKLYIRQAAWS